MQPDIHASPNSRIAGAFAQPVMSASPGFAAPVASATLTTSNDAGSVVGAGTRSVSTDAGLPTTTHGTPAHTNGNGVAHANGNGVAHTNSHGSIAMGSWTTGLAASAEAGDTFATSTVLAAHLPPRGFYLRRGKRMIDTVGAAVALVLHSPLLLLAAIAIKLESRGPVFYRSTRIGKNGQPFTFLKLRSMVDGADRTRHYVSHLNEADGPIFKIANDPRVTRVGRFLRVTSIDEIPQFINVLRGEMSLVGPRPALPHEVAQYEPWQLSRLDVLPGITCLWQISGRSRIGFQEWMRLDLEYIKHRSAGLDAKILLRTIPAVLSRDGAY